MPGNPESQRNVGAGNIRKILDENKVLLDQSIIDTIREHFIELHGTRAEDK